MLKRNKKGFYEFQEFKRLKGLPADRQGLIYGISSREFGDCRTKIAENWKNIDKFLAALELKKENLVLMEQVHGNKIKVVCKNDTGKVIADTDGLITSTPRVILGVKTADCLATLFYEPKAKIIGACHSGWRGILACLPQKMIDRMIQLGADPKNILVAIGPFIGGCCYDIKADRAQQFEKVFGKLKKMIIRCHNQLMLDLAIPAKVQLIHSGVLAKNIEFSDICTSCRNKEFYSFRKDRKKDYGAILSVIGLRV